MRRFYLLVLIFLLLSAMTATGCSIVHRSIHASRSSFPFKYAYHPSYEAIGALYKNDPSLAIELLERLSAKHPNNLAYRLTLADMYKDAGRANDAIRLWFDILDISRKRGTSSGKGLKVYFIPMAPQQEEGMRPYQQKIDKSLAYTNIALIYLKNGFYEEAAEYFSRAAESAQDLNRKAELYEQAGIAIGSKEVEVPIAEKGGTSEQTPEEPTGPVDRMHYRKKEVAFYLMALSLDFSDSGLREKIKKERASVEQEIRNYEGKTPAVAAEERDRMEP
jgi:tetratricopeptide (TPR) repeat protein